MLKGHLWRLRLNPFLRYVVSHLFSSVALRSIDFSIVKYYCCSLYTCKIPSDSSAISTQS